MAHNRAQEISRDESFAIMNDQVTISRICIDVTNLAARGVIPHHHAQFMIGNLQSASAGRLTMRRFAHHHVTRTIMPAPTRWRAVPASTAAAEETTMPSSSVAGPNHPSSTTTPSPARPKAKSPETAADEKVDDFIRRANGAKIRVAAVPSPVIAAVPIPVASVRYVFHGDDLMATEESNAEKEKENANPQKERHKKGEMRNKDEFDPFVDPMVGFNPQKYRNNS